MKQLSISGAAKFFIVIFFICGSCKAQTKTNAVIEEAKKSILKNNAIYFDLYAKNDGSILSLYTEDACLLPPNAPAICGHDALAKDFKDTYATGTVKGGKFTTLNVYGDGLEYITEEGLWQVFGADGKLIDDGKFLKLWKKTKEGWKMFRDSFNSNHSQK